MPAKDPLVLRHAHPGLLPAYRRIQGNRRRRWPSNPLVMDAVCRNITIIGEAARKLDESFHREHPEIPWSGIIGARNIVMHAYEYLKPRLIREMAENDVPA